MVETEVRHLRASHSDSAAGQVSQTERPSAGLPAAAAAVLEVVGIAQTNGRRAFRRR